MANSPLLTFSDGHTIPQLGLGVYKASDAETRVSVAAALDAGYRHIDTAKLYENETAVGDAVRASGLPREEVFVTTKVWQDDHGYDEARRAFDASLTRLGFDYLDLYLIHWPAPAQNRYVDTWRALASLKADGLVRSIGVSNFNPSHVDRLIDETGIVPVINQIELHPRHQQAAVREYDAAHGILTEAWAPLARGGVLGSEPFTAIAAKHGKTPAQVVIRWHLELGNVVIPKSVTPERIVANFDVFDFELDADDRAAIARLDPSDGAGRTGGDPDTVG
jgi:2,5-diketo-D-gluconate reductase A